MAIFNSKLLVDQRLNRYVLMQKNLRFPKKHISAVSPRWPGSRNWLPSKNESAVMWLKQCHKPPIWEWWKQPPMKMVMTGGWFMTLFYPHYLKQASK